MLQCPVPHRQQLQSQNFTKDELPTLRGGSVWSPHSQQSSQCGGRLVLNVPSDLALERYG